MREVDLAEALQLDLGRQLRFDRGRELRLGQLALLERIQRMLSALLRGLLERDAENAGIGAHDLVPARERLPQRVRQHASEVGDDRADLRHAAAGAGSRTVSSYRPAPRCVSIRQSIAAAWTSRPSGARDAPAVTAPNARRGKSSPGSHSSMLAWRGRPSPS